MSAEEFRRYDSMKLFLHQIYEFRKGVRNLVLCTMCRNLCRAACRTARATGNRLIWYRRSP
ncbi:protein containing Domain of unknown function DUF2023, partial [human gut metagenome]